VKYQRLFAVVLSLLLSGSLAGKDIIVDDSYSPGERYARYKPEHPELEWPLQTFRAGQSIAFERPYKRLARRDLHADVFYPSVENQNGQAIVLVHGGGWRSGNKSHFYPLAHLLAQRGYVVMTPEYRLSVEAPYPAGMIDINDAISWLRERAEDFSINPDKIAIGGGSSGGQMAALAGHAAQSGKYHSQPAQNSTVNAVIDLDGVLDFTTELALQFENKKQHNSAAALWLGGTYEELPQIWAEASATHSLHRQSPPTLIISSGQPRFTAGHAEITAYLKKHHIIHQYIELDKTIHTFWLFEPYLSKTAQWIDTFLQRVQKQGEQQ
jgi:pectinesterase